jgi:hypothetical protein|tara:strand:+ start:92 stop:877 length:786 start_codon:yes stop_codon:yes gene_type:complete
MNPLHKNLIEKLEYTPVGLGDENFEQGWLTDDTHDNISFKNKSYGEYTFHYWLWKNKQLDFNGWIGFCQYRKFWKKEIGNQQVDSIEKLNKIVLKEIPRELKDFDSILLESQFINQFRLSKFVKHNLKIMLLNPSLFFNKKKRTIKFHFDMMHGHGNLDKAIQVLDEKEKIDFKNFVNREVSFNPQNMFICKNKEILFAYYESLFPWLLRCEKIFGFKDLKGFGLQRIYGFLAERYMSYWFKKYTKYVILQMQFKDISDFL